MGQPFCALDFKGRDEIEGTKARKKVQRERRKVENPPKEEFHWQRGIARG